MKIKEVKERPTIKVNEKLNKAYVQFEKLIELLNLIELDDEVVREINLHIEALNALSDSAIELKSQIRKRQTKIVSLIEKKLKVVPKNHYRNMWLVLGMSVFGVPMGVAFSVSLGNMAFIGIGLPIGMAIGIAVGSGMDKKAFDAGRQLDIELK